MATVTYEGATCLFPGTSRPAVDRLDLSIEDGELLVLVGPSGCGKSTSLRMLAGLEEVSAGRILIGGTDVSTQEPKDRDIAMVFQNYALYPHMSVAENMGFALKLAKTPKAEIARRVKETAALLDLTEYLDRKPKALSGGQRQRVAMGRAIVREPHVFLMDEPLSNLDAKLRVQTRTQIAELQRRLATTTVYVTHDQVEAMTMGDRVAVLKDGVLQQCAPPRELYSRPANVFVAGFMGSPAMNLLTLPVADGGVRVGDTTIPIPRATLDSAGGQGGQAREIREIVVGLRPESLEPIGLADAEDSRSAAGVTVAMEVDMVEELGSDAYIYGTVAVGERREHLIARADWRRPPHRGERITLRIDPDTVHVFSAETGRRLGE